MNIGRTIKKTAPAWKISRQNFSQNNNSFRERSQERKTLYFPEDGRNGTQRWCSSMSTVCCLLSTHTEQNEIGKLIVQNDGFVIQFVVHLHHDIQRPQKPQRHQRISFKIRSCHWFSWKRHWSWSPSKRLLRLQLRAWNNFFLEMRSENNHWPSTTSPTWWFFQSALTSLFWNSD